MKKSLLLGVIISLVFLACKKEEDPAETSYFFRAEINGMEWQPDGASGVMDYNYSKEFHDMSIKTIEHDSLPDGVNTST